MLLPNNRLKQIGTLLLLLAISLTSCESDLITSTSFNTERVDLKIEGDLNTVFNSEEKDIIEFESLQDHGIDFEGCKLNIQLSENEMIRIELFTYLTNKPLEESIEFSSFSSNLFSDKYSFATISYMRDNKKLFSSSANHLINSEQFDVLETKSFDNHTLIRLNDFQLFDYQINLPMNEVIDPQVDDITTITLNGTFRVLK